MICSACGKETFKDDQVKWSRANCNSVASLCVPCSDNGYILAVQKIFRGDLKDVRENKIWFNEEVG